MVKLYRENGVYFVESKMELRFPIEINGVVYSKKETETLEDVDLVYAILERNGRVLIKEDDKFKRLTLGEFADILTGKKYTLIDGLPPVYDNIKLDEVDVHEEKDENVQQLVMEEQSDTQTQQQQNNQQYNNNKKRNKERHNNEQKQPQINNVQQEQKGDDK